MQNLRHPQRGLADLGENRRIWGVRRTKVRRAPKSAIEKVRIYIENFEEIQPITVSFPKFRQVGLFFLFSTGFFDLVKCDSPFYIYASSTNTLFIASSFPYPSRVSGSRSLPSVHSFHAFIVNILVFNSLPSNILFTLLNAFSNSSGVLFTKILENG